MRQHILDTPISYYAIFFVAKCLPLTVCRWIGKAVALTVYIFSQRDRHGFAVNLSIALNMPADSARVRRLVRRMFANYGEYMADFFRLPQMAPHKVDTVFAGLKGEHIIKAALARG
ncbi:MAG: hypothetical protein KJO34_02410, partial [Deltaproteobacteria bacterium]|nr:hypothetical protein [Deltaproteobacteria bacterium]